MSRRRAGLGVGLGLSVALGLGSVGCTHEGEVALSDPFERTRTLEADELHELLWPRAEERWRELGATQHAALRELVILLWHRAERGALRERERERAGALAELAGVRVESVALRVPGREEPIGLWIVYEEDTPRRGTGAYLIRRGEIEVGRVELLLETPHVFHDRHTGDIGLAVLLGQGGASPVRGLFVNTVHRHRLPSGAKHKPPKGYGPADAAHSERHPISRVHGAIVRRHRVAVLQLHGFERNAASGDPEMIVSSGSETPSPGSRVLAKALAEAFPKDAVGNYGLDSDRLGGTTNVQGHLARESRRCFVHLELGDDLRDRLDDGADARARFVEAVRGWAQEIQRGGCR